MSDEQRDQHHDEHGDSDEQFSGPLAWFTKNSVAANLLMIILMAGGIIMAPRIKQEVFPEVSLDIVSVNVPYPGASPEDVEQGVILPVEEAVREAEDVDEISSVASEGMGMVMAELRTGADAQQALDDIKSGVDRITSFPENAEDPQIALASNRRQVVTIMIHGDLDRHTLKQLGEEARDELIQAGDISVVDVTGLPEPEISIEVPQDKQRLYGVTLPQVAQAVRTANIDLPGGSLRTEGGEILVRTEELRKVAHKFRDIKVISRRDGTQVPLHRVANLEDTFRETDRATYFDGEPAVKVEVYRVGDQTPLDIAAVVDELVKKKNANSSEKVSYSIWNDTSDIYRGRMNLLLENSYIGLALVLFILGLFLEIKLAFWVTLGIPISFLGAMLFMPALGVSLNMISLFAFILTLGIVVDDAIVVGEAIYHKRTEGKSLMTAAIEGLREVDTPVVFAVLTTCIAFSPLLFVPGVSGKFFINIPMIVIPIFLISLVEVLLILPAHLAHSKPPKQTGVIGFINGLQARFANMLEAFVERIFQPIIRVGISYRYVTIALSFGILMMCVGLLRGGFIGFTFMPKIEGDRIMASVEMPVGTPVEETRRVTDRLVETAQEVLGENRGEAKGDRLYTGILAELGVAGSMQQGPGPQIADSGGHLTEVAVSLVPAAERTLTAKEFTTQWRSKMGEVAGADTVNFSYSMGPSTGEPVSIELRHENTDTLRAAAEELTAKIETYTGVFDVNDGFRPGKEQLDLRLKPAARTLGLTESDLANQVRAAFYGAEADRVQRGRDELRIYVRRPESERDSQYAIENMLIQTRNGGEIPLKQAALIERGRASTEIERENGARAVDVTADVDSSITTGNEVTANLQADVLPQLMADYPGLSWELSGEQQEQAESLGALGRGFLMAMLVMYALMAIAFGSYVQPLVIMFAIPFGFVGAMAGHLLMGFNLSLISIMGLVALSGVVVNDSLVLVAAVNDFRDDGMSPFEALVNGGMRRFRPILLTSLTTFFGLMPMIFETSIQARFLIPMALSLGFGVLFVTGIALLIVPSFYMIIEDFRYVGQRIAALYRE